MRVGDSLVVLAEDYVVVNPLTCQGDSTHHPPPVAAGDVLVVNPLTRQGERQDSTLHPSSPRRGRYHS